VTLLARVVFTCISRFYLCSTVFKPSDARAVYETVCRNSQRLGCNCTVDQTVASMQDFRVLCLGMEIPWDSRRFFCG